MAAGPRGYDPELDGSEQALERLFEGVAAGRAQAGVVGTVRSCHSLPPALSVCLLVTASLPCRSPLAEVYEPW